MAKILTEEILKALKKFDLPKGYQRTGEFPLDPSSVFASKADADLYAAGGADSRGLSGTRYAGQLIAVVENGVTTLYTVESNDTLKAVGGDVSADLATLTSRVDAILAGNHEGLDSLADIKAKFDSLKDLVVESGVVRVATEEELTADPSLITGDLYIVLTIKNSNEKLFIPAKALVDAYTGSDYVAVSDTNVISLKITDLEAKLVTDEFAKKSDITDITSTLATTESVNAVKATADAAASKADVNEGKIGTLENTVGNAESGLVKDVAALQSLIDTMNPGYQFMGVATPETNPGTPDQKVFYIANGKGTYTNFGGVQVTEDEVVILYYDTDWHKVSTGIASDEKLSGLVNKEDDIEQKINQSISSEAFTFSNFKYINGNLASATIVWFDGTNGTMTIVYNADSTINYIRYKYGNDFYRNTFTYNADGSVASNAITKE